MGLIGLESLQTGLDTKLRYLSNQGCEDPLHFCSVPRGVLEGLHVPQHDYSHGRRGWGRGREGAEVSFASF